jgi:pyruvate/2-oxoglutarate dehydrogenase complex dihydrolipoamide acyltransferase (E2) component
MPTSDESRPALPTDEPIGAQSEAVATDTAGALEESVVITHAGDGLSPAVRRLVRQYDLDITGIHGTGPDGRIRVGDVIGMLGPRAEQAVHGPVPPRPAPVEVEAGAEDVDTKQDEPATATPAATTAASATTPAAVTTTVFECDVGRVLAHRKRLRAENVELLLTSYFLAAYVEALGAVPVLALGAAPCIGVELTTADGETRTLTLDASGTAELPLSERARTIDAALRRSVGADLADANLLVHHYGASGSLIATPTPLGVGHVASLGIGRVRREIVLRNIDGDETPRVTTRCHLSLSFLPEHVTLARANQFLAHTVRVLEQWPD